MEAAKGARDEIFLLSLIKAGDESAFKELFFRYSPKLCLWSCKITEDKQTAEDIVQEFFIQFWNKKEQLDFNPSFAAYAFRSVYNASLNFLRDNEKYVYGVTLMGVSDEDIEVESELQVNLMNAIEELPEKCRKVFVMVTLDKKKHNEVASHFGISVNTVKVQVSKAYRILRKKMGIFLFF